MKNIYSIIMFSSILSFFSACEIVENLEDPARNTFKDLYTIEKSDVNYRIIDIETKKLEYLVKPSQKKGVIYDVCWGSDTDLVGYEVVKDGKHYRISSTSSASSDYFVMTENLYGNDGYDIFDGYDFDHAVYLIRGNKVKGEY